MHVLIAGCGWLGSAVAQQLLERGDRVSGVRTDPKRVEALRSMGIEPLRLDLADPASADQIPPSVEAIIAMQSAQSEGETAYRRAYIEANRTLLEVARRRSIKSFIYTGSTGVFGQRDGSDVDESSPPAPASPTARILVEAEQRIQEAEGIPACIIRLSGLYGPGRTWMIDRVRRGLMSLGPGDEAWLNSCHQDDAVQVILAALDRGRKGAVYHATDARPVRRRDVLAFLAERLEITLPVLESGPAAGGPNRRIWGERTRMEFGIRPRWPSLLEGLAPFLEVPQGKFA